MDIEELRTFVEVADAGGVTPGARRLGISKSIVSRRLARLEEEMGVQLIARTTRGSGLTEAGVTFREHAARVCAEIDTAREAILPAGDIRGLLRVSAPLTFGPTHLAPVLAEMARRHPLLHIHVSYTDRFVDLMSEGFDCSIRIGFLRDSNLMVRCIGPMGGKLVASPEYIRIHGAPEAPHDILNHSALMQGTEAWCFMDGDKTITIHPSGRFKSDNGTALLSAALAGLGVAILPDGILDEHLASGALVALMEKFPLPTAGIYVARPPSPHPARKVRVLTEMLVECFGRSNAVAAGPPA